MRLIPWGKRYVINKQNGCWEWQRPLTAYGHGYLTYKHKQYSEGLAHREAWVRAFGAIPEGSCVLHRCDNPPCVNPAHLFLGSRVDNNADRTVKGRTGTALRAGEGARMVRLRDCEVEEIIRLHKLGLPQWFVAKMFRTRQSYVSRLCNGVRRQYGTVGKSRWETA
jgi:hypothetical protein